MCEQKQLNKKKEINMRSGKKQKKAQNKGKGKELSTGEQIFWTYFQVSSSSVTSYDAHIPVFGSFENFLIETVPIMSQGHGRSFSHQKVISNTVESRR